MGFHISEGLPPVPAKIAAKISNWEFVEMLELFPEFWSSACDEDGNSKRVSRVRVKKKGPGYPCVVAVLCSVRGCPGVHIPRVSTGADRSAFCEQVGSMRVQHGPIMMQPSAPGSGHRK